MKDKQLAKLIAKETKRQESVVNLIASENIVSKDVLEALGSIFTNKYAEGYPEKRYYGGNTITDELERLCQKRALQAFGLSGKTWSVNVQALSGSSANIAVYTALVPLGAKIMGMSLSAGGHLTHGHKASVSGKFWTPVAFGVDAKTEVIDYDQIERQACTERPALIVAGFTAYPRKVDWKRFRAIADASGALLLVDMSHLAGLIAGKAYPNPFPYADIVTTTTHKTLRGPRSALIFSRIDERGIPEKIDRAVFPGLQGGPHMNQISAVAIALKEAHEPKFKIYAKQVVKNAQALGKELSRLGWHVVSGGTDSHMILLDTWMNGEGLSGREASERLENAGIIVNMNTIPGDTRSASDPSGIRLGTPAQTTRGWKESQFIRLAQKIDGILRAR
jgi:glycine hydroxymethyltransferase